MRFAAMDTNKDGVISRGEWNGNDQSFRAHDWNGDGVLKGDEVRPAQGRQGTGTSSRGTARFDTLDSNRDGRISRAEWRGTVERFDVLDGNLDGVVTRAEFDAEYAGPGEPATPQRSEAWKKGFERGVIDGRQAGREDREGPKVWDLEGQRELETADAGYDARFGSRTDYQDGYRDGFRRAYREGFGPR